MCKFPKRYQPVVLLILTTTNMAMTVISNPTEEQVTTTAMKVPCSKPAIWNVQRGT